MTIASAVAFHLKVTGETTVCWTYSGSPCRGRISKHACIGGPSDLHVQLATNSGRRRQALPFIIVYQTALVKNRGWGCCPPAARRAWGARVFIGGQGARLKVGVASKMSLAFDKTLDTLALQEARRWQEFKNGDWK